MPLENAPVGSAGFSKNVATEIRAGKPPAQAAAIAYSKARGDESPALDKLLSAADELYAKADATGWGSGEKRGDAAGQDKPRDGMRYPDIKGPDGKWYVHGTKFHKIDGKIHAIHPNNRVHDAAQMNASRKDSAAVRNDSDCEADANERPVAHLRHKGVMIDTSFKKGSNGTEVDYYVVEGSSGRFYTLSAAKEVAERIAERKSRKDSSPAWEIRRDGDEWEALGTSGGKPKAYRLPVKEFATEADAMAWVEHNEESKRADAGDSIKEAVEQKLGRAMKPSEVARFRRLREKGYTDVRDILTGIRDLIDARGDAETLSVKEAKRLGKEYAERGNSRQRLQEVLRAEGADGAAMRAALESFDKV